MPPSLATDPVCSPVLQHHVIVVKTAEVVPVQRIAISNVNARDENGGQRKLLYRVAQYKHSPKLSHPTIMPLDEGHSCLAERITALFVKHTQRPGKYPDGGNLYLQVRKSTRNIETDAVTKSWLFRYSRFGKDTWLGY